MLHPLILRVAAQVTAKTTLNMGGEWNCVYIHTGKLSAEQEGGVVGPDPVGPVGRLLVHCHRLLAEIAVGDHLEKGVEIF